MNLFKSKAIVGILCFILGVVTVLLAQTRFTHPRITLIASNPASPMKMNMDSIFDQFYNDDFFSQANDPFEDMRKMRNQMLLQFDQPKQGGDLFDSWYQKKFGGGNAGEIKKREDDQFIYYEVTIRDVEKEKLKVKVENGQISISGQIESKSEDDGNVSYSSSSFHRSFPAPTGVDVERFKMEQNQDRLIIKFPKLNKKSAINLVYPV
jgi:HSP20 family molecular chaperone IbpA